MDCKIKGHCFFWGAIVVACILLVTLLWRSTWFSNINVEYGFVPVDAIGILVSAAVTVWVGLNIAKNLTESRFEKDYLIVDLNKMESIVSEMERLYKSSTFVDLSNITSMNVELQSIIKRFTDTVKIMNNSSSKYAELKYLADKVYQKTTNVDGQYVEVDKINIPELDTAFNKFILEVRKQIIAVNQA